MTAITEGTALPGGLSVVRVLADDVTGIVCEARAEADGGVCRVRCTPEGMLAGDEERRSFLAAVHATARLDGAPRLLDAGVLDDDGRGFVVTEPTPGDSLAILVAARGPLSIQEAAPILRSIGQTLKAAHAAGIGHGMLRPDLVCLTPSASSLRPVVLDVGVMGWLIEHGIGRRAKTTSWSGMTWIHGYRLLGRSDALEGDDCFGFGLLAHYLLTGRNLWKTRGDGFAERMALFTEMMAVYRRTPSPNTEGVHLVEPLPEAFQAWLGTALRGDDLSSVARELEMLAKRLEVQKAIAREEAELAAHPPAPPSGDERAVGAAEWPAILESCRGDEAMPDVVLDAGRAVAGGVEWTLPTGLAWRSARILAAQILAAARAVEGAPRVGDGGLGATIAKLFGRGGERRYCASLETLDLAPPMRRESYQFFDRALLATPRDGDACAGLDADGLTVEHAFEIWITAHERGVVSEPYARVPKDALPMDLDRFEALVRAIAAAAGSIGGYPLPPEPTAPRACKYCGRSGEGLAMYDRHTCEACAAEYFKIIY